MEFRPCIDLKNGQVVQIVGGTLNDNDEKKLKINFKSDHTPEHFAKLYQKDQLHGGHVIALGPGNEKAALGALEAFPGGLQYGGGVNPSNATLYLDAGASHVIVTSYIFKDGSLDWERLKEMNSSVGKDRLVLDLSCRRKEDRYWVVMDRWQTFTDLEVDSSTLEQLSEYCSEFLVHGADVEGKKAGVEDELIKTLGNHSPIPSTYAGGVRYFSDFEKVQSLGENKVHLTIGSALDLFGGEVPYRDLVEWHHQQR